MYTNTVQKEAFFCESNPNKYYIIKNPITNIQT